MKEAKRKKKTTSKMRIGFERAAASWPRPRLIVFVAAAAAIVSLSLLAPIRPNLGWAQAQLQGEWIELSR